MKDWSKEQPGVNANKDPITGQHGAHPIATGLGAVGVGAAAGATGGAVAGPVGVVTGAVIGAVAGGVAGHAVAEAVDPTEEKEHWRNTHRSKPYAQSGNYGDYEPAYRYGWESFDRHGGEGKTFDNLEADLARGWEKAKGSSRLKWDQAKAATRDAWDRVASRGSAAH